ncbi:MAG TPA: TetR family transcriptional regulator, partial [Alphaproteobacteria bacterium]|nr:TetR family transcriptional regulator [Alphaproteobacteria bacterium]
MARRAEDGGAEGEIRDGRIRRTERSRAKMVKAFFELVGEGVLQPTAQQVAERAGVGIRTVFRHFSEMDRLFAEIDAMVREQIEPHLVRRTGEGAVADRAVALVHDRAALFERFAPYMRATRISRLRSEFLRRTFAEFVRRQRAALLEALPELAGAPADLQDAFEVATSFETWDRLRTDQRLGAARTRAAMERTVLA